MTVLKKRRTLNTPFVCGWRDLDDEPIYGLASDPHCLYKLHVNESGIGTPVSTPHALKEWDYDVQPTKSSPMGVVTRMH
eukprot:6192794-Pleurochrysis_carterae.AAC.3